MKASKVITLGILLPFFSLPSIDSGFAAEGTRVCETESDAVRTADELVAFVYPDFRPMLKTWKPIVDDIQGQAWEVSYAAPGLVNAGSPVVIFNKKTCEVWRIYYHD